jgi:KDO2-lipid IV(A) lauroyltransferase
MSISEKTLNKRYKVLNADLANSYFNQGKSIICLTSHYGNWEYGILATNNAIEHQAVALYLPLSNKYSESYGLKRRTRFGMNLVAIQETKSIFAKEPEKPLAIIMAADQSPSNLERAIWVDFLNQNTACLHGAEAYAKKLNIPVLYLKISKLKRGYYSLEFEKLIENPSEYKPDEITKIYMNRLEKDIIEMPEFWLWSHRRWKHKKQL